MAQVTVEELAGEAGIPLQFLSKAFHKEHAYLLAGFCVPWETIGYHLKLSKSNISSIEDDNTTTEKKRIATLEKWKEIFAHKATYRVLIEALIESEHGQQALELCKKVKHELLATEQPEIQNVNVSTTLKPSLLTCTTEQSVTDCHDAVNEEVISDNINVTESIHQLQMQFICVQNRFLQSGTGTGVSLEQLQTCVSTLPAFATDSPQVLLEASSVNRFTHSLKEYCCALNPDILEGLIEVLGDVETKFMMKQYIKDLHDFQSRTKLKDFIGNYNGPTPPKFKEVQLKLGDNWREKTLADIKLLNSQMSRQSWLMKAVSERSIYVSFMIPKVDDLEMGVHLRAYLQTQGVLQILVRGLCIFKCKGT